MMFFPVLEDRPQALPFCRVSPDCSYFYYTFYVMPILSKLSKQAHWDLVQRQGVEILTMKTHSHTSIIIVNKHCNQVILKHQVVFRITSLQFE